VKGVLGACLLASLVLPVRVAAVSGDVIPGLDVLVGEEFARLRGKRVGLVANHTARDRRGRHAADLLASAEGVTLAAIFAPEHGYRGVETGAVADGKDDRTGAPVFSLYGETRKPTPAMLSGIDLLVFDIQDVGARFYTYISTMARAMEAAAEAGIPFVVLDRPNPIGGEVVEGPVLDPGQRSFVGIHPIALRHGMTVGELASLFAAEFLEGKRLDLAVVRVEGWRRAQRYDECDLPWIVPSPNMTDLETALVYPGLCLLEGTNVSEGRGTDSPFLVVGAPWIDGERLARALSKAGVAGVSFEATSFTPRSLPGRAPKPRFEGERCSGVRVRVTDPAAMRAVELAVRFLCAVRDLHPGSLRLEPRSFDRLAGAPWLREAIEAGKAPAEILPRIAEEAAGFERERAPFLLYE